MDINLNNAVIFVNSDMNLAHVLKPLENKGGWLEYLVFLRDHIGDYASNVEETPLYISNSWMRVQVEVFKRMGLEIMTWKRIKEQLQKEVAVSCEYCEDHNPCLGRIHYTATWNH